MKKLWYTTSFASQQHMLAHPRGHPQSTTISSSLLSLKCSQWILPILGLQAPYCFIDNNTCEAGLGEDLPPIFLKLLRNEDAISSLQVQILSKSFGYFTPCVY